MFVIKCLKPRTNDIRYLDRSYYPSITPYLDRATKFETVAEAEQYVESVARLSAGGQYLGVGEGWIMCYIEEVITKVVKNIV